MAIRGMTRAPRKASGHVFVSAVGQSWAKEVVCPACGQPAEHDDGGRHWRCSDQRCSFHHGWRLRPSGQSEDVDVGEERYDEQDRMMVRQRVTRSSPVVVAVPLLEGGAEDPEHSVAWPRPIDG